MSKKLVSRIKKFNNMFSDILDRESDFEDVYLRDHTYNIEDALKAKQVPVGLKNRSLRKFVTREVELAFSDIDDLEKVLKDTLHKLCQLSRLLLDIEDQAILDAQKLDKEACNNKKAGKKA